MSYTKQTWTANDLVTSQKMNHIEQGIEEATDAFDAILLNVYPVGSIYISTNNINPSAYFGGTWVAFGQGKTLVGVDENQTEFDTIEKTGGNKTIDLSHSHTVDSHSHKEKTEIFSDAHGTGNGLQYTQGGTVLYNRADLYTQNASPNTDSKLSNAQSILPPYITVYMWKRTA